MARTEALSISGHVEFDPGRHISKLLHDSEKSRVVLFCLEAGQELSPHKSPSEVIFYGVEGTPEIVLGDERVPLEPKSMLVCPSMVPHGIVSGKGRSVVLAVITPRPA